MKKYLIVLFILISAKTNAQSYFNNTYNAIDTYNLGSSIALTEGGYIALGQLLTSNDRQIMFVKLNNNGNVVWKRYYSTPPKVYYAQKIITKKWGYYVAGSVSDTSSSSNYSFFLSKFDTSGTNIWLNRYGTIGYSINPDLKETSDGGFILAGESNGQIYLVKTDSAGNKKWDKYYGGSGTDAAYSIQETSDNNYIISGYTTSFGGDYDMYVIKTDTAGNMLWQKEYGTTGDDNTAFIKEAKDGNYLIAGAISSGVSSYKGYLAKISKTNGTIIWQKNYDKNGYLLFYSDPIENTDETIVVSGLAKNGSNAYIGILYKTLPIGDTLWTRQYYTRIDKGGNYINDIKPTIDSGYVFCGQAWSNDSVSTQDVWVVKVDCMGADSIHYYFPNSTCSTTGYGVGVQELVVENEEFKIYPNPTSLTLTLSKGEGMQDASIEEVKIYNVLGEEIKNLVLRMKNEKSVTIDVNELKSGIYFVVLMKNGVSVKTEKLIINK